MTSLDASSVSGPTNYETIYARVPKPTRRKIEAIRKMNGYPSVSQTINALVENAGNEDAFLEQFAKVLTEVKDASNRPLSDLTVGEVFDAIQKRAKKR